MQKSAFLCALLLALIVAVALPLYAGGPGLSGAIFTTLPDGSEVNFNIFSDKMDVYLDGGPPIGAPAGAAGLPGPGSTVFGTTISGTYVFQVTSPSGKTLLSTDAAQCREFTVDVNGVINGVTGPCPHATGINTNTQNGGTTVQLFPFDDTPNNGGEYKVWVTPIEFFGCSLTATGSARNCGVGKFGWGFIPSDSKTDNFKVKVSAVREIDTRFLDGDGNFIDGLGITWIDTNGASNNKNSYYNPDLVVIHEAHVEAPENGTHQIVVSNQAGCTVGTVYLNGRALSNNGPQTVAVKVLSSYKNVTLRVDVQCQ
jgi:hypothetical protein